MNAVLKNNEGLSRREIVQFKELFGQEKARLLHNQKVVDANYEFRRDDLLDPLDHTATALETDMRIRLRSRESLYLRKVEDALKRCVEGTFGDCLQCGDFIGLRRLNARPTTDLCLSCKETSESVEAHFSEAASAMSAVEILREYFGIGALATV